MTFNWERANETDVREEFLAPLIRGLGYRRNKVNELVTEHTLHYDKATLGRKKKGDPTLTGRIDYFSKRQEMRVGSWKQNLQQETFKSMKYLKPYLMLGIPKFRPSMLLSQMGDRLSSSVFRKCLTMNQSLSSVLSRSMTLWIGFWQLCHQIAFEGLLSARQSHKPSP